jgi:hypothetical protein
LAVFFRRESVAVDLHCSRFCADLNLSTAWNESVLGLCRSESFINSWWLALQRFLQSFTDAPASERFGTSTESAPCDGGKAESRARARICIP